MSGTGDGPATATPGQALVNGEPVPETTGSTGVSWEDTPNRHAYCDSEIRRLREQAAALEMARQTDLSQIGYFRELAAEILDAFGPSGSGHTARVGQVQIAKWRTRAGLTKEG